MDTIAHKITSDRSGLTALIHYDEMPSNPRRDCDPLGHFIVWWNSYDLGDDKPRRMGYDTPEDFISYAKSKAMRGAVVIPVYVYEHSGITMKAGTGFSCPWDSGQAGWIWMTREEVHKEFGKGPAAYRQARKSLIASVEEYASYLEGDVYGVTVIDEEGNSVHADDCWGFVGFEYAQKEARTILAGAIRYQREAKKMERNAFAL